MKKMIKKASKGVAHFFNALVKVNEMNLKSRGLM